MKTYTVDEAFKILKVNKITTNKESVRRWLRQGIIKGIAPASRKEGWTITESELQEFIQQRLPKYYTTSVVKEDDATSVVYKDYDRKCLELGQRAKVLLDLYKEQPKEFDRDKVLDELLKMYTHLKLDLEQ